MDERRKRVTTPRIMTAPSALLAGAALYTASDPKRQGMQAEGYTKAAETADDTIMACMNGGDLEGSYWIAIADLRGMMDILRTAGQEENLPSLHMVVGAGGSIRQELDEIDGAPYARFSLTENGVSSVGPMRIKNIGDVNILTDFVDYGIRPYPASHHGLVLWNHGGGPVGGYGSSSYSDGDGPSLEKVREALDYSVVAGRTFDFVTSSACLMGSMGIADCLGRRVGYAIAPPELGPQDKYNYSWVATLGGSLSSDMEWGGAVGWSMMDAYDAYHTSNIAPVVMSLLDMKEYLAFHEVFHQYVGGIPQELREELYRELRRDRIKILASGNRQAGDSSELVSVLEFPDVCQSVYPDEGAFRILKERMGKLVTGQRVKGYPGNPGDLTIYPPSGPNPYLGENLETYDTTGLCGVYRQLTDEYAAYLVRESNVGWRDMNVHKDDAAEINVAPKNASDMAGAYLAVFCLVRSNGGYYLPCTDSDVDINVDDALRAVPENNYMGMKERVLCLIETMNLDVYTEYMAPILYNRELHTMRIGFNKGHEDGQVLSMALTGQTSEAAKQTYKLKEGNRVTPLYLVKHIESVEEEPVDGARDKAKGEIINGAKDETKDRANDGTEGKIRDETGNTAGNSCGEASHNPSQITEDGYHTGGYYMGTELYIEESDDMLLETVPIPGDGYLYGFTLVDVRQNIYYTNLTGIETEDTGS